MTIDEIRRVRDDARRRGDTYLEDLANEALPYSWGAEYTVVSSAALDESREMLERCLRDRGVR